MRTSNGRGDTLSPVAFVPRPRVGTAAFLLTLVLAGLAVWATVQPWLDVSLDSLAGLADEVAEQGLAGVDVQGQVAGAVEGSGVASPELGQTLGSTVEGAIAGLPDTLREAAAQGYGPLEMGIGWFFLLLLAVCICCLIVARVRGGRGWLVVVAVSLFLTALSAFGLAVLLVVAEVAYAAFLPSAWEPFGPEVSVRLVAWVAPFAAGFAWLVTLTAWLKAGGGAERGVPVPVPVHAPRSYP